MGRQLERPFEYLRRKNGEPFTPDIVKNWYEARAYVMDKLQEVTFLPESNEHLHVVIWGDSPLMLSVARQVALLAHYANYKESSCSNRTLITFISKNRDLMEVLKKEEYLSNLPNYCKYSLFGSESMNDDSYTDIELQLLEDWKHEDNDRCIEMSEKDAKAFLETKKEDEVYCIDTRKAVLSNRIYQLGSLIDNLPAEDIHCAERYAMALDVFQHDLLRDPIKPMVNERVWQKDLIKVKNGLSNIFCTDCFESRALAMTKSWPKYNEAFTESEHARWLVEKLVMGFRSFNEEERLHDEELFGAKKKQYRDHMKKNASDPCHIDLCSFADLRRINPDDLKYDTFMMLAIPIILKKTNKKS